MRKKQTFDVTGTPLTPSFMGRKCLGNGKYTDYEICCENCDYYLKCFPKLFIRFKGLLDRYFG